MKKNEILKKSLSIFICFLFVALLLDVIYQIVARTVFAAPTTFTEELAKVILVWLVFFGTSLTVLEREHLSMDLISEKASQKLKTRIIVFGDLLVLLFGIILLIGGLGITKNAWALNQVVPVLNFSMAWVYLALPLNGALISIFSFKDIWRNRWNI